MRSPQDSGYPDTSWTTPLLQRELETRVRNPGVGRHGPAWPLPRLGYTWKRPRYVLDPDPEREKKRRIRRQIRALPRRSVVLAEDETDLMMFPPLRAGWSPRGEPAEVGLSGLERPPCDLRGDEPANRDAGLAAAAQGAKPRLSGVPRRGPLELPGWHVALLLDEDPSHTAKASLRGRGDDAVVAAEAGARVEPDGHAVGPGEGRDRGQRQDTRRSTTRSIASSTTSTVCRAGRRCIPPASSPMTSG